MKQTEFIKEFLGDGFLEDIAKSEVLKPVTQTVVDPEELASALRIVPRIVMSWLIKELSPLEDGQTADLKIPFPQANGATLQLKKLSKDVYSGDIVSENKVVNRFLYRTIPGIGLILLTTFEMYSMDELDKTKSQPQDMSNYIQTIVDERLKMRDLVNSVVDKKISEREAVESMVLARINSKIKEPKIEVKKESSLDKLQDFLTKVKDKKHTIKMNKSEVSCVDCGSLIMKNEKITPCICYGDDRFNKITLKKTDNGYLLGFSKKWDVDNIEMILETLRKGAK